MYRNGRVERRDLTPEPRHPERLVRGYSTIGRRAGPDHAALVEHDDVVGEQPHFGDVVRDVDDRDGELVADALEVRQDAAAALDVDGGQRLVEQQQLGRRHQRARERDALALAA